MILYRQVRAVRLVSLIALLVTLLVAWPGAATGMTPSPTGATVMFAVFVAVAVPIVVGWACGRGDIRLEATGVRPVARYDIAFAGLACGAVAAALAALHAMGLADSGLSVARAMLAYLGLMLVALPFWGWRLAPLLPTVFLLAVAVFGGGPDTEHPAAWAFIAAQEADPASWAITAMILTVGMLVALGRPPRLDLSGAEIAG